MGTSVSFIERQPFIAGCYCGGSKTYASAAHVASATAWQSSIWLDSKNHADYLQRWHCTGAVVREGLEILRAM